MKKLQLEYLKPQTTVRYDFYLIFKLFIDNAAFDGIDCVAKLLYSLMLNHVSLSAINAKDVTDKDGWLYIISTLEQVILMRCGLMGR